MPDQRFLRAYRIRRGADFDRIFRRRVTASDQNLLVFGCENALAFPRLGLSVSRKVGRAVVRNRWKRMIREAFRLTRERLPGGIDYVVIPRRGAEPDLGRLRASLPRLARRVASKLGKEGK